MSKYIMTFHHHPGLHPSAEKLISTISILLMFNFFSCIGQQPDIAARYDEVTFFSEGLAAVKKDNLWGFVDTLGNLKIGYQFTQTENFASGLCKVKAKGSLNEDLYGIIRKDGTFLLPLEYEEVYIHQQEIAFSSHGKYGFMNRKTNEIIHLDKEKLIGFQNDLDLISGFQKTGSSLSTMKNTGCWIGMAICF